MIQARGLVQTFHTRQGRKKVEVKAVDDFGVENPYTSLVPGLLVQLGIFGAFFAGFG